MYQRMEQDGREEHIRPATHFVSHSFTSTFDAIINMLETVAHDYEQKSNKQAFFFIDVLGNGYHPGRFVSAPWLVAISSGIKKMTGGLVCCNFEWDKPNHLERAWMLWEAYVTIACGQPITLALSTAEVQKLVEELRQKNGPEKILNIVSRLEADPALTQCSVETDKILLRQEMQRLSHETFPHAKKPHLQMSQKLANATRIAYADAADRFYKRNVSNLDDLTNDPDFAARTTDLGHNIALLRALTGESNRAIEICTEILPLLPEDVLFSHISPDVLTAAPPTDDPAALMLFERHRIIRRRHKVAARDATVVLLASVLRNQHQNDLADAAIRHWLDRDLPLSFRGVSLSFIENFVKNPHHVRNF